MWQRRKLTFWLPALLAMVALLAVGCGGGDVSQEDYDALQTELAGVQSELDAKGEALPPQKLIQIGVSGEAPPALVAPTGWHTTWSQLMEVNLLETFDSSGPELWDPAEHPLVYFASEGAGYGGLVSAGVTLPGYLAIDAYTRETLAGPHYDVGQLAPETPDLEGVSGPHFEPHGLGVSPDGRFIYIPTAVGGTGFSGAKEAGRLIIVNSKTGNMHQLLQVPGRPHHIVGYIDTEGRDRVMAYSWNYGAYILDPNDDHKVVGAVPNGELQGRGYLAFVHPSAKYIFYTVRPPRGVEAHGSIAIIDAETFKYIRSMEVHDSSPIFVTFDAEGATAFVTGGHESTVTKMDISSEDPSDWEVVKSGRAGTEGPYGVNLTWEDDMLITIGKGEGSHNKGITVGLVDPNLPGSARPLGEIYTGCMRADHAIIHPDPELRELWISCNSRFETVIFDLSKRETRATFSEPGGYIIDRIPTPNGGSTHNGAFVAYEADWTGILLADQNGLHGAAREAKLQIKASLASR
ncbi:MAG: WD40 repeat domain-containing protein [Chloroflexi bacterium]|nr:WD40 repeat domain-containing protein [Chloroflexota bacterium]